MGALDREPASDDGTPRWLGKYEVLRLLGRGGMAEVYLGRATGIEGFEKLVALKRILPQHAAEPSLVELFLEEARIAATLDHPNVVHVHDIGQDSGGYFFAMEFVHGIDALRLLRAAHRDRQPIPIDVALSLAIGACAGLHHAHEKKSLEGEPRSIVHCDVTPSNVLVTFDGAVKVTDFGIAKALRSAASASMTGPRGKRGYMSPEQCIGAPMDRRADIFSLGVVLYELTTGQPMFDRAGDGDLPVLERITRGAAKRPSEVAPGYPPELERILARAVQVRAEERYRTAQEMQLDLEAFARDHKLAISPVTVARCLRRLFGDEIGAWEEAQRDGVGLVAHLTRTLHGTSSTGDTTVPARSAVVRRPSRVRWLVAVGLLAALGIAGGVAALLAGRETEPAQERPAAREAPAPAAPDDPIEEVEGPPEPAADREEPPRKAEPTRSSGRSRRAARRKEPAEQPPTVKPPAPAWDRDGLSTPP